MIEPMNEIPDETIEAVRALAAEGLPVEQVAFLTRVSEQSVRAILAAGDAKANAAPSGGSVS